MRYHLVVLMSLLMLPCVSSCDLFVPEGPPVVTMWISDIGGIGLEMKQRGNRFSGKAFWLSEDGERFTQFFCHGLFDRHNKTMLFPLEFKRAKSIKTLREGSSPYVEFELDLDREYIVGKWRTGEESPEYERDFYPYEG